MEEIQKIHLEPMPNASHYELVHSLLEFALKCELVTAELARWLAAYQAAVEREEYIFGISLRSDLTEPLSETDRERDGIATGAKAITNAQMKNPAEEVRNAAREVLNQFISLKVDTSANYMEQTGQIDNLLNTLTKSYAAQLELLGLTKVMEYLKDANDRMHLLLNERDLKQYPRSNGALEEARAETDIAFRAFFKAFNAYILLNAEELEQNDRGARLFITEANAKIDYFKRYVLKQPSSNKPEEGEPGEGEQQPGETTPGEGEQQPTTPTEPTNPTKYNAVFTANGSTVATQQYEAGEVIQAPEAPSGYEWEEFPYRMPEHDITVNAVRKYVPGGGGGSGFE